MRYLLASLGAIILTADPSKIPNPISTVSNTVSNSPPDQTVKVAIITGSLAVVAAAVTAFAATFQKSRPVESIIPPGPVEDEEDDDERYHSELLRRATTAETALIQAQEQRDTYLRYLYVNRIDPTTGEAMS